MGGVGSQGKGVHEPQGHCRCINQLLQDFWAAGLHPGPKVRCASEEYMPKTFDSELCRGLCGHKRRMSLTDLLSVLFLSRCPKERYSSVCFFRRETC